MADTSTEPFRLMGLTGIFDRDGFMRRRKAKLIIGGSRIRMYEMSMGLRAGFPPSIQEFPSACVSVPAYGGTQMHAIADLVNFAAGMQRCRSALCLIYIPLPYQ
jgi:hypothetical protein